MGTDTLTTKGQITIPAEVRKDLKVEAGDRVEFVLIAQSPQATRLIESLDAEGPGYITTVSIVEIYEVLMASCECAPLTTPSHS